VDYLVSPRWTNAIHYEWMRNLVAHGRVSLDRLFRTHELMQRVLSEVTVRGFEWRIAGLALPDPDDRHVLAAPIEAEAEAVVTFNIKHSPADMLAEFGIAARHPDAFLCALYAEDSEAVLAVVDAARFNLTATAPDHDAFIVALEQQGLAKFAALLRAQ
jgi:hypothetical protein